LFGRLFGGRARDVDAPAVVAMLDNRAEAELLAGFLRDKGVRAIVSADDEGGLAPNIAAMRRVRVLVRGTDAERARELMEAID
jgi:uncharacterized protein with PIN domain